MIMKGSYDMKRIVLAWKKSSLIKRIAIGIALGAVLGLTFPKLSAIGLLGDIFVGGLKGIAPLLVFALVTNALSQHRKGQETNMKTIIILYLLGTFSAALVAVLANYLFLYTSHSQRQRPRLHHQMGLGKSSVICCSK